MTPSAPRSGRRRFLGVGLTAILAAAVKPLYAALHVAGGRASPRAAHRLVQSLNHPRHAAVVGRAYLARTPHEAHAKVLMRLLHKDDAHLRTILRSDDGAVLREHLARRVRQDFHDARVVHVRGWVLARTEARIYALGALLDS